MSNPRRAKVFPALIAVAILAIIGVVMGIVQVSRTFDSRVATYREQQEAEEAATDSEVNVATSHAAEEPKPLVMEAAIDEDSKEEPSEVVIESAEAPVTLQEESTEEDEERYTAIIEAARREASGVSGRVLDMESKAPLVGVEVRQAPIIGQQFQTPSPASLDFSDPVITDSSGYFYFSGYEDVLPDTMYGSPTPVRMIEVSGLHSDQKMYWLFVRGLLGREWDLLVPPTGTITGRVINNRDDPISNIDVFVVSSGLNDPSVPYAHHHNQPMRTAISKVTTDSDGRFEVRDALKDHQFSIEIPLGSGFIYNRQQYSPKQRDVTIRLPNRNHSIRGRVAFADGAPAQVEVTVRRSQYSNIDPDSSTYLLKVISDPQGHFSFPNLYAGQYTLIVDHPSRKSIFGESAGPVLKTVNLGDEHSGDVDITLDAMDPKVVKLLNWGDDSPAAGVELVIADDEGGEKVVTTDSNGLAYIPPQGTNPQTFRIRAPYVHVHWGSETDLSISPHAEIRAHAEYGTVESPYIYKVKKLERFVQLSFQDQGGEPVRPESVSVKYFTSRDYVRQQAEARFQRPTSPYRQPVPSEGIIQVEARHEGSIAFQEIDLRMLPKEEVPDITLTLTPQPVLIVKTVDVKGAPVADVPISVTNWESSWIAVQGTASLPIGRRNHRTNAEGILVLDNLLPTDYMISIPRSEEIRRSEGRETKVSYERIGFFSDPTMVSLSEKSGNEVILVVNEMELFEITSRLLDDSEKPLANTPIEIRFQNINGQAIHNLIPVQEARTTTDSDGNFSYSLRLPSEVARFHIGLISDSAIGHQNRTMSLSLAAVPESVMLISAGTQRAESSRPFSSRTFAVINGETNKPVPNIRYMMDDPDYTNPASTSDKLTVDARNPDGLFTIEVPMWRGTAITFQELAAGRPTDFKMTVSEARFPGSGLRLLPNGALEVRLHRGSSLAVKVVEREKNSPVSDIDVLLLPESYDYPIGSEIGEAIIQHVVAFGVTGNGGRTKLEAVPAARYKLIVDATGYLPVEHRVTFPHPSDEFLIELDTTSTIRGSVVDHRNQPLAGEEVHLEGAYQLGTANSSKSGFQRIKTTTDEHGRFEISGVYPGSRGVVVGHHSKLRVGEALDVEAGKEYELAFVVPRPIEVKLSARLNGRLVANPQNLRIIQTIAESGSFSVQDAPFTIRPTSERGVFTFEILPGKIQVSLKTDTGYTPQQEVILDAGQLSQRIDLTFEDYTVNAVMVLPAGVRAGMIQIYLLDESGQTVRRINHYDNTEAIRIGGLSAGRYKVRAESRTNTGRFVGTSDYFTPSTNPESVYTRVILEELSTLN